MGGGFVGLDPTLLMTAIARETEKIGLVTTVSTSFNPPYVVARQIQSLHWISKGRAGWNVVKVVWGPGWDALLAKDKTLAELRIRSTSGVTITRINRSGIDLVAAGNLQLQLGDRVTVVGPELSVAHAERLFGNSLKRLNHPNLIPIFIGIALGVVLGSISFWIPGVPQPVKLGLAGGPLIVAILIGRYGPYYRLITYTTMSANLMLREIGIALFLAAVEIGRAHV